MRPDHQPPRTPKTDTPDVIETRLADLRAKRDTAAVLLVSIGAARMRRLGTAIPQPFTFPEQRLYALLAREPRDAAHLR